MKIKIVGDGGIGSNLGLPLIKLLSQEANSDVPVEITIVDGDKVEQKNLVRQQFIEDDIGEYKTEVTASYLSQVSEGLGSKHVQVKSHPSYLSEENVDFLIEEGDIVLVGVDNYRTRKIIEDHAITLDNVLVINGGNEYDDGDINVYHRKDGEEKTPLYSSKHPEINTKDKLPDEIGCEEAMVSAPQLVLANLTVAQHMLEAFYYYTKKGEVAWHERFFDLKQGNVRTVK